MNHIRYNKERNDCEEDAEDPFEGGLESGVGGGDVSGGVDFGVGADGCDEVIGFAVQVKGVTFRYYLFFHVLRAVAVNGSGSVGDGGHSEGIAPGVELHGDRGDFPQGVVELLIDKRSQRVVNHISCLLVDFLFQRLPARCAALREQDNESCKDNR